MKRILVLALALIVAVGSLAVPSYAAESNNHSMVDLLQAVEYDFYKGSNKDVTSYSSAMNGWVDNKSTASWEFSHIPPDRYSYQIVTILAWSQPSSFFYEDTNGNTTQGTLIGTSPASQGTYYQYRVGWYNSTGRIRYTANWGSNYTGGYSIISAFGALNDTLELSNVSYFGNAMLYDNGGGEYIPPDGDDFRFPLSVKSVNNGSFPAVVSFTGPTGSRFYSLDYGEVFLKVNFDNTFKYFDQVTFLIYTSGTIKSIGSRLENPDGSVVDGFDLELEYCGETQMLFELEENFQRIHCYLVTVDTKGHDFSGKVLSLQTCVDSVLGSFVYEYDRGFYFQCASAVAKYDINDIPWYSFFALWLDKVLDANNNKFLASISDLGDLISESLSSIYDQIVFNFSKLFSVYDDVLSWLSSLHQQIVFNFSKLFEFLGVSGDNQQFEDDVGQQGDKLDDMAGIMDSVQKPDLGSINTDLSGIVSPSDTANIAQVYTMVIGDDFVPQIMTMVVVMAMMSFVLFGKR